MFTAVIFTTAKTDEQIKLKHTRTHTMTYYSAFQKELLPSATICCSTIDQSTFG